MTGRARIAHYAQFLGGSVLCAGINNVILIAGDWLGYGYALLIVVCYAVSGTVGYVYHCRITFGDPMTWAGFARFSAGLWLGLPVSLAILAVLSDVLMLPMWIAGPVMTVMMVAYHYLVSRWTITAGRRLAAPENV